MADGQGHSPGKIKRKERIRGGCPVLPVLSKPDGFCGRKAILKQEEGGGAGLSQELDYSLLQVLTVAFRTIIVSL